MMRAASCMIELTSLPLRLGVPNPSLLFSRHVTSIGQTPHFYLPGPAAPCWAVLGRVGAGPGGAVPIWTMSPCQPDTGTSLLCEATVPPLSH